MFAFVLIALHFLMTIIEIHQYKYVHCLYVQKNIKN